MFFAPSALVPRFSTRQQDSTCTSKQGTRHYNPPGKHLGQPEANTAHYYTTCLDRSTHKAHLTQATANTHTHIHLPQDTGNLRDTVALTLPPTTTGSPLAHNFHQRGNHCRSQVAAILPGCHRQTPSHTKRTHRDSRTDPASKSGNKTFGHSSPEHSTPEQTTPQSRAPLSMKPKSTIKIMGPQRCGQTRRTIITHYQHINSIIRFLITCRNHLDMLLCSLVLMPLSDSRELVQGLLYKAGNDHGDYPLVWCRMVTLGISLRQHQLIK